jgi:hypothetical protein
VNGYFCENVAKVRNAGCSVSVEITPYDDLIPDIDAIKTFSMERFGTLPHITVARDEINRKNGLPRYTKLPKEEYEKVWGQFDSELFRFKSAIFQQKIRSFCYAGQWDFVLDLPTGNARQCYCGDFLQNIFQDIALPLRERPVGTYCQQHHCYNGHAFLTLGLVPEYSCPSYADMRDRVCTDGSHWLSPRMAAFFSQKLYENNEELSNSEKRRLNRRPIGVKLKHIVKRILFFRAVRVLLQQVKTISAYLSRRIQGKR